MNTKSNLKNRSNRYQSSREVFQEYIPGYDFARNSTDSFDWNPVTNGEETAERLLDQFAQSISAGEKAN